MPTHRVLITLGELKQFVKAKYSVEGDVEIFENNELLMDGWIGQTEIHDEHYVLQFDQESE